MKWLLTSDIHLSDKPRDEYRFDIFPWLVTQQKKLGIEATFIVGDLTENKDRHSSKLVNQIMDALILLRPPVYIVRGNHDGINPDNPFFRFVNHIDGIRMIVSPEEVLPGLYAIPHQRTQAEFDDACQIIKPKSHVMVHQTFEGAQAETGSRLSGLSATHIESLKPLAVWAGDVHKPQQCGPVTYLGAPYHVRFGDQYVPRIVSLNDGKATDLHFECPRKWSLAVHDADEILHNKKLRKDDQVKITVKLTREEVTEWAEHKQRCLDACQTLGLHVYGIEMEVAEVKRPTKAEVRATAPQDVLRSYCKAENLGTELREAGLELLEQ